MTGYKIPGYFTAPATPLEALERERERTAACMDRAVQHYATILKDMDAEIADLKRRNDDAAISLPKTPEIANFATPFEAGDMSTGGGE